jgi:hypothetical protein
MRLIGVQPSGGLSARAELRFTIVNALRIVLYQLFRRSNLRVPAKMTYCD